MQYNNKVVPMGAESIESIKLPEINESQKFKHDELIELSHEKVENNPIFEHEESKSRKEKGQELELLPIPKQQLLSADTAIVKGVITSDSNQNESRETATKLPKRKIVKKNKIITKKDDHRAQHFKHQTRQETGEFLSLSHLEQVNNISTVLQTQAIINELKKVNKIKQEENDENTDEDEKDDEQMGTFDAGAKDQNQNKAVFRKNFGLELQLPTYYIQDAKVYPNNLHYVLKVVKYVLPDDNSYEMKEYKQGQEPTVKKISESYTGDNFDKDNCVLQLMEKRGDNLQIKMEVAIIGSKRVSIAFSPDGKYFALFRVHLNVLRIYKIDNENIVGLLEKVEKQNYEKEYNENPLLQNKINDVPQHLRMHFDMNSRFLALYSDQCVNIVNIVDETTEIFQKDQFDIRVAHQNTFDKILDVQLVSTSDTEYRCDVAANVKGQKTVTIFDVQTEEPLKSLRQISYELPFCRKKTAICKISHDFKKIILSNGDENFILTKDQDGDGYTQRTIGWIKQKKVTYIVAVKNDFIFICHKDYDQNLDIESSATENFKIMIDRNIEPDLIKVLDVAQSNINEEGFGDRMVIINFKQDRFYYDLINPQQRMDNLSSRNASEAGTPCNKQRKIKLSPPIKNEEVTATMDFANTIVQNEENSCVIGSYEYSPSGSHCVMWPYMSMSGIQDTVWIFCAFDPKFLKRIVPEYNFGHFRVEQTFITEEFDLFYLIENIDEKQFELWYTDLDNPLGFIDFSDQKFEMEKIYTYPMSAVNRTQCYDMFIRSPSGKAGGNVNKKLFAFFLHRHGLYCWISGSKNIELIETTQSLNLVKINSNEFVYRNDSCDEEDNPIFTLKKIKAQYSVYSSQNIYTEQEKTRVKAYSYDNYSNVVTVMFKDRNKNGETYNRFKIFDLNTQSTVINFLVNDKDIVGRFTSQLFTLIKGHYYFNNKVYKIRYDLFNQIQTRLLSQEEAFDKYDKLLDLKPGEQVVANTPICSIELHKMAYFTRNPRYSKPMKLIILPYLHERKLYLNKMKPNNKYFYTTIKLYEGDQKMLQEFGQDDKNKLVQAQHEIIAVDITGEKFFVYNEGGKMTHRFDYKEMMKDAGKPIEVSNNGRIFMFCKDGQPSIISIYALQRDEFKFIRKVNIPEEIKKYAKKNIECQQTEEDMKAAYNLSKDLNGEYGTYFFDTNVLYEYAINDNMDFTIQISSKQEIELERQLNTTFPEHERANIIKLLEYCKLQDQVKKNAEEKRRYQKLINLYSSLICRDTSRLIYKMPIDYKIKILERLKYTRVSIFYVERSKKFINKSDMLGVSAIRQSHDSKYDEDQCYQEVFFTKDQKIFENFVSGSFSMNKDNIIFWNNFQVWFYKLDEISNATKQEFHICKLNVDKDEKESWIKRVRAGCEKNHISVRVRQSALIDASIIWDIEKDVEVEAIDHHHDDSCIFDSNGSPYIIHADGVTIIDQGVKTRCYDVEGFTSKETKEHLSFGSSYGFRFDELNHNWVLCNEYISLSFSFLTLVIRDRMQQSDDDSEYMFDTDQYNFIINRKTFLTCDDFYVLEHDKLDYVLGELYKVDPVLIEQLHYYDDREKDDAMDDTFANRSFFDILKDDQELKNKIRFQKKTPLHIAKSNNRSVNIILHYMSLIPYNASETFKDIMYLFVENPSFQEYIKNLPFQTIQMKTKQTLQVSEQYNQHIVSCKGAACSYVDDAYFRINMSEDMKSKDNNNYPVKVVALRIAWILTDDGKKFLEAVLNSSDLNIYTNKTMVVTIEFLYQYFRNRVLMTQLPVYFVQLAIFCIAVMIPIDEQSFLKDATSILNLISSIYTFILIATNTYLITETYYKSQWAYFEIVYFILNFIISIGLINTNKSWFGDHQQIVSKEQFRVVASFLSVVIFSKALYYMQIIDQIANIVTVIFLIFKDITWFVIIFCMYIFSFAISFYLISYNQIEYDQIPAGADGLGMVNYNTIMGAISHVFQIALGQFELCVYSLGLASQQTVLYIFWVATIFMMMIHLLNFLIAIMGQTFSDNNDVKDKDALRSHLRFVLSNWWMDPIPQKDKTIYLITAFLKDGKDEEGDDLDNIQNQLDSLKQSQTEIKAKLFQITNKY